MSKVRVRKIRNPKALKIHYDLDMADKSSVRGQIEYSGFPSEHLDFLEGVFDNAVGAKHIKDATDKDVVETYSAIIDALTTIRDAIGGEELPMPPE